MQRKENIKRVEGLLARIQRSGMENLINFLQKSDFYTAPASTRFHLSCEGGLLQHSLNVYDALVGKLEPRQNSDGEQRFIFTISGAPVAAFKEETIIIVALLHDLCKTGFYTIEQRWRKDKDNKWEQYNVYGINDKTPYGHGEKSAMMASEFIHLTQEELFAIRWHMGMSSGSQQDIQTYNQACDKYPLVHLLHMADQEASHYMEGMNGNVEPFIKASQDAAPDASEWADAPAY